MSEEFYQYQPLEANEIHEESLLAIHHFVQKAPHFYFVGFGKIDGEKAIITDIEINIPQFSKLGLKRKERLAICTFDDRQKQPRVLALRIGFPAFSHQNLCTKDSPRDLCIFDTDYRDTLAYRSPVIVVKRAREWLTRCVNRSLHLPEQPIEPFIATYPFWVALDVGVKNKLDNDKDCDLFVHGGYIDEKLNLHYIELSWKKNTQKDKNGIHSFHCIALSVEPTSELIVHQAPDNLDTLDKLFHPYGLDIAKKISDKIRDWTGTGVFADLVQKSLLFLLKVPRTREGSCKIETEEWLCFTSNNSIGEIALSLELVGKHDGKYAPILEKKLPDEATLKKIKLVNCRVVLPVDRKMALRISGVEKNYDEKKIVAIGGGSLGANVILNMARQGFGDWTIVDKDILLPHNYVRHSLSKCYVGLPKAQAVAEEVRLLFGRPSNFIVADVQGGTKEQREFFEKKLREADLIIDTTASLDVMRTLATHSEIKNRIAVSYMGEMGKTSVIILENVDRSIRVDDLELQLSVLSLYDSFWSSIFQKSNKREIAYANGCSAQTAVISQDHVALHAAQMSRYIKVNYDKDAARLLVTILNDNGYGIESREYIASSVVVIKKDAWEFRISDFAKARMERFRKEKLPNETGGVLIGIVDFSSQIIYIGDVLPSPIDSEEWPTSYVRGCKYLRRELKRILRITSDHLHYVGEWHSHPDGCSVNMSTDDERALGWLSENAAIDGLPGIVMIVGENSIGCYIKALWKQK